jgi:hypothetical protein
MSRLGQALWCKPTKVSKGISPISDSVCATPFVMPRMAMSNICSAVRTVDGASLPGSMRMMPRAPARSSSAPTVANCTGWTAGAATRPRWWRRTSQAARYGCWPKTRGPTSPRCCSTPRPIARSRRQPLSSGHGGRCWTPTTRRTSAISRADHRAIWRSPACRGTDAAGSSPMCMTMRRWNTFITTATGSGRGGCSRRRLPWRGHHW